MGIMCSCFRRHDDNDGDTNGDLNNKKHKKIKIFRRFCEVCRRKSHSKGKVSPATQIHSTESTTNIPDYITNKEHVIAEPQVESNLISNLTVTPNATCPITNKEHVIAEPQVDNNMNSDLIVTPYLPDSIISEEHVIVEAQEENNLDINSPPTLYELCSNIIKVHVTLETRHIVTDTTYASPVTILNNLSTKENIPITYLWINLDPYNKLIGPPPYFLYQAKCRDICGYGKGKTKKLAKRNAAADLLKQLNL